MLLYLLAKVVSFWANMSSFPFGSATGYKLLRTCAKNVIWYFVHCTRAVKLFYALVQKNVDSKAAFFSF